MDGGLPRCSRRRVDEMTEDELDYVLGMTDDGRRSIEGGGFDDEPPEPTAAAGSGVCCYASQINA